MSHLISIGSSQHIDFIRDKLKEESNFWQTKGVILKLQEDVLGGYTFWNVKNVIGINDDFPEEDIIFSLRYAIAKFLTDLIVGKHAHKLIDGVVRKYKSYLTQDEQKHVINKTGKIMNSGHVQRLKNNILQAIFTYLETEKVLILDGFIPFRLKTYQEEIAVATEQAVDEYLMEREYDDFIQLLKYFVDIQEPKLDKIHVVMLKSGGFQLYDEQGQEIKNDYLESFIIELVDSELNYEDLLISTLITLVPQEIVLHIPKDSGGDTAIDTIISVFDDRASVCTGCSKCIRPPQQHEKS